MKKKMRVKVKDIGRWVTVKWDDVGNQDALLVDVNLSCNQGKVLIPRSEPETIDLDQIVDVRSYVTPA